MTTTILPQVEKSIKFDRITGDFCVTVNDECIGYAATYTAGETLADDYVFDQLVRQHAQAPSVQEAASALATAAQDAGDTRNARALNKAALKLAEGVQAVEVVTGEYLIPSGSRDGLVHRVSVNRGCSCEAGVKGVPCWPAALVEIITAAQHAARVVEVLPKIICLNARICGRCGAVEHLMRDDYMGHLICSRCCTPYAPRYARAA